MTDRGHSSRERTGSARAAVAVLALLVLFSACSVMFPNTERAIQPEGTTLDELGIAVMADVEMWIDSMLYVLGTLGWL